MDGIAMNRKSLSNIIRNAAFESGFSACGISKAGFLESEAPKMERWLRDGHHGEMAYMENHLDLRLDPTKLVPGAKTIISLAYNYFPESNQNKEAPIVSKYAYGSDYHVVVKDRMREMIAKIETHTGKTEGRIFTDSAPILERAWAVKSGIGWVGKNGNLIIKKSGSFFFLAEWITDLEPEYDLAFTTDHCGSCQACIDACPTDAILPQKNIDGSKCISYFTIELKKNIPNEVKRNLSDRLFGCDICQDVCPWNRFSQPTKESAFKIKPMIKNYTSENWMEITEEIFNKEFKDSPIKRRGFQGIMDNLRALNHSSPSD